MNNLSECNQVELEMHRCKNDDRQCKLCGDACALGLFKHLIILEWDRYYA